MTASIVTLPENLYLSELIMESLDCRIVRTTITEFPDGESYVRLHSPVDRAIVFVVGSLDRPNEKLLPLIFLALKLREMGASKIVLVTPYLPYMRQDKEFNPGECVTSAYFADILSQYVDHLITVDPHLHRHQGLDEIYKVSTHCLHIAPLMASWIKNNVANPVVLGPDSESKQWVKEIASAADVPYKIFSKQRFSSDKVAIENVDLSLFYDHTPVLVDDIISTASTMITLVKQLQQLNHQPVCMAIHGVFSGNAYQELMKSGVSQVVTTNSINQISSKIDISSVLVSAIQDYLNTVNK
jgi:ribose-phosphate pyrophosphokinase